MIVAGGGFKNGVALGKTDKNAMQVVENAYSPISYGRTLYHLLGIDADTVVNTLNNRPIKLIAEDAPLIKEALA